MIFVVLAIPTAHRISRHTIPDGTQHLINGKAGRLAKDVPNSNIDKRHRELRDALNALILERSPQVSTNTSRKGRILADENRFNFVFENGLNDARAARDRSEVAICPACDASVRKHPEHDSARCRAEI